MYFQYFKESRTLLYLFSKNGNIKKRKQNIKILIQISYCCSIFRHKFPIILQSYQSFINIYSFQWKLANKNKKKYQTHAKIRHPIQIRKKLEISVVAFNLWWSQQKNNDISKYLTVIICSRKVDDLLKKATDLYRLSVKRTGGGRQNMPPSPPWLRRSKTPHDKYG